MAGYGYGYVGDMHNQRTDYPQIPPEGARDSCRVAPLESDALHASAVRG
jgi:hypothetical protein